MLDPDSLRDFAAELAEASGRAIAGMFRHPDLAVETKGDDSPVTVADRYAETLLRDRILERFPDHGIVGEEFGAVREDAEYVWVLDPIDGTISFVAGVPLFGTLIALLHEGEPILGVIHQPVTRELAIGTPSGTTINGEVVRVREDRSLAEAMLLMTDPGAVGRHQDGARFETLCAPRGAVPRLGRLLRIPYARVGAGGRHARPDHEPVGYRGARAGRTGGWRRNHHLGGR